ncbi:MAG: GNAT family N-acetyltransferase [Woeseia sp.]
MKFEVRTATVNDVGAMLALLPRLADFDVPAHRQPEHLWEHDGALLRSWLAGEAPQCLVEVAVADSGIVGLTMTSMQPDPLTHEPAAHLEVIAVAARAEGKGVGRALLVAAEQNARERGARSITLHVIDSNSRARHFYEQSGYVGEMIRYIKSL